MKKLSCITILFLFSLFILVVSGSAADLVTAPVLKNTDKLKNIKITVTNPSKQSRSTETITGKQQPTITFKSTTVTRTSRGAWHWEVKITSPQKRQVKPNTAKVMVWQNAGGKKILLERNIYDRPIYPSYGSFQNDFFPSGLSDTLDFELIELNPDETKPFPSNTNNVVDRKTVAVPPFDIRMPIAGYSFYDAPEYLHANLQNKSSLPMNVKVIMRGGDFQHWTTIRHQEVVLLEGNSQTTVRKNWTFTEKGGGYYKITAEVYLLNPATGKSKWTEILKKKAPLPTQ